MPHQIPDKTSTSPRSIEGYARVKLQGPPERPVVRTARPDRIRAPYGDSGRGFLALCPPGQAGDWHCELLVRAGQLQYPLQAACRCREAWCVDGGRSAAGVPDHLPWGEPDEAV